MVNRIESLSKLQWAMIHPGSSCARDLRTDRVESIEGSPLPRTCSDRSMAALYVILRIPCAVSIVYKPRRRIKSQHP